MSSTFDLTDIQVFLALTSFLLWKWNKSGFFDTGTDLSWYEAYKSQVVLSPSGILLGILLVVDYVSLFLVGYLFFREFQPPIVTNSYYLWVFIIFAVHVIFDKVWLVLFYDAGEFYSAVAVAVLQVGTAITLMVLCLGGGAAYLLAPLIITIILRGLRAIMTIQWFRLRLKIGFPTSRAQAMKQEQRAKEDYISQGGQGALDYAMR